MAEHCDLTVSVRHAAPVRLRVRAGLAERFAFDPMSTPVRIRAVDPASLKARDLPIGIAAGNAAPTIRVEAMDGVLWRRLTCIGPEGVAVPTTLEDAVQVISGARIGFVSPFAPALPESHRLRSHQGDAPIPARTLARASLRLHDRAEAKVRAVAEHALVHDGRSILMAMNHPLLVFEKGRDTAAVGWRRSTTAWSPMFRHDRPGEVAAMQRTMGWSEADIARDQAIKVELSEGLVWAMHGIEPRDDDVRQFVNKASFVVADCLAAYEEDERPAGLAQELDALCALAAIDDVDLDVRCVSRLFRAVTRDASSKIRGAGHNALRGAAFLIDRYLTQVVEPRLANAPVPPEDAEALDALAP